MNPKTRPAEASGVAAALALLICRLLGVEDADTIVALGIVVGFIPAAVTWAVNLSRPKGERGYSLVEVLLAVFMVLVILVVLSWLV